MPKKKHPEHVNHERWLVSYADFITLLFAFFVVMYAISQADLAKLQKVAKSIRAAFGGGGGQDSFIDVEGTGGGKTVTPFDEWPESGGRMANLPAGKTHTAAEPDTNLQELKELLEETISVEVGVAEFNENLEIYYDRDALVLKLAVKNIFAEGSAEIENDIQPLVEKIGSIVTSHSKKIFRIEGHADLSEVRTKKYATSWELSSARSASVARLWVDRFQINPARMGIVGYGHYRPLTKDRSHLSKSSNRRVEVVITRVDFKEDLNRLRESN